MNHSFSKSNFHPNCAVCNKNETSHSNQATCEACSNIGPCNIVNNILLCNECESKEMDARLNILNSSTTVDKILSDTWKCSNCSVINNILNKQCTKCKSIRPTEYDSLAKMDNLILSTSRAIDQNITVKTDLFNAHTISIEELRLAIENDPSIENKNYKLAEVLKERHEHFQHIIFDNNAIIVDAANGQKAIQVYLNNLANKLRSEERTKLKLADITYEVKPVGPIKAPSIKKPIKKFDSASIKRVSAELTKEFGKPIPEFMVQTVAVSNNCDADMAGNILRRNIKESMSMDVKA